MEVKEIVAELETQIARLKEARALLAGRQRAQRDVADHSVQRTPPSKGRRSIV